MVFVKRQASGECILKILVACKKKSVVHTQYSKEKLSQFG